jgi:hypothetical protein
VLLDFRRSCGFPGSIIEVFDCVNPIPVTLEQIFPLLDHTHRLQSGLKPFF